jgi:membrane fusion protein, multidrug efflux system
MIHLLRTAVSLLLLGGATWFVFHLVATRPDPPRFEIPEPLIRVEAITLAPTTFTVPVRSRGTVRPRTESTLVPEVSGRIVGVAEALREGSFFLGGDLLLQLETTDYETAVVIARGQVAQAELALAEERARGEQALENWRRLGQQGEPSPLVRRVPQLADAEARLSAAEANLALAQRNLERTSLRAPFEGRVLEKFVDVGQFVSTGTVLARLYATDSAEIRLPLTDQQIGFLDLPERYRDSDLTPLDPIPVTISGRYGGQLHSWQGTIVRAEGAIDEVTRQLYVVAQVADPYAEREPGQPPLKAGLFVEAEIPGREMQDVFVVPRKAVRPGGQLVLIDPSGRLRLRQAEILWGDETTVVLPAASGPDDPSPLQPGTVLCITPLAFPTDGQPVEAIIDGIEPPPPPDQQRQGPRPGAPQRS